MRHLRFILTLPFLACFSFTTVTSQTNDGYVGIYSDPAGTTPCVAIPPFTADTLYVLARTEGQTTNGITGAEFRIEVTDTSGWLTFAFTPVASATLVLGDPIDTNPDPNTGGGISIVFDACQQPDANGVVRLGILYLMNINGNSNFLLVKRHSAPTNTTYFCPLFTLCDAPAYSKLCMSPAAGDTCFVGVGKPGPHIANDGPVFIARLNNEGVGPVPGAQDSISTEARAMRERGLQTGFSEVDLSWRTPAETRAWKRTMPAWMKKVSIRILNLTRLLHEKNLLIQENRHLAVQYSTDMIPVDSLARLRLELRGVNTTSLDAAFFHGIGGTLIQALPEYGLLTAWVPPEQIQSLAERADVLAIGHGAGASNGGPGEPKIEEGSVTTEGDALHRARELRDKRHVSGFGQRVAVISGGAQNWQDSAYDFDLPPSIQVVNGLGQGDEGTAMMEVVHDIAPESPLVFSAINGGTQADAITAIRQAKQSLAKVIVDDFAIWGEPLFEVGSVAGERRLAVQAGAFYVATAGNVAQQHYQGYYSAGTIYYRTPCSTLTEFDRPHRFSGNDQLLKIRVNAVANPNKPETHWLMLQWNERWGYAYLDFSLHLLNVNGCIVLSSGAPEPGKPVELLGFSWPHTYSEEFDLLIDYNGGGTTPPSTYLDLRCLGQSNESWLEHVNPSGSIDAAARLPEVYAVGAVDVRATTQVTIESGRGPARQFHPNDITYQKPDAVGATYVSITGAGFFGTGQCPMIYPGSCRFIGTSAAAPHIAGVAALLREACPGLSPAQIAAALNCGADRLYGGVNYNSGYGIVNAVKAVNCACPDPAAQIYLYRVFDGIAHWHVSTEYETTGYILEGSQTADGPWTQIGPIQPPGSVEYSVDVTSSGFQLIRLVELETNGGRLIHGVETSGPQPVPDPPLPDDAALVAKLDSLEQVWQSSGGGPPPTGIKYVIFTPSVFLQDVQNYVAHYWEMRGGYDPIVVNTDSYPQPPDHDGFRQTLKASIATYASQGAKYFHLIGDWNDWREATDPGVYPSLWVGTWESIRQQYTATCPPQDSLDLVPTYVIPDTQPRGRNMAFGTPYWFSDQEYADTNSDGVPDVVLTRWPVANRAQLLGLIYKMMVYNDWPDAAGPHAISSYVYDIDYAADTGDGLRAGEVADSILAEVPTGEVIYRINRSDFQDTGTWRATATANWNYNLPDVVFVVGSGSNRYEPGKLLLSPGGLNGDAMPLLVGASCATADFAASEDPARGLPQSQQLLTWPYSGPIAWIGPTAGTWQDGNLVVARHIAKSLFADLNRPMAESWREAVQEAISENQSEDRVRFVNTARSYVFLGDPLSRLKHSRGLPTDIAGSHGLLPRTGPIRNVPNPFNPSTRIYFVTGHSGPVSLRIYDIHGRFIRTLVDATLPAGWHGVDWKGDREDGQRMPSGVYLYQLVAEGSSFTRKLTLVK